MRTLLTAGLWFLLSFFHLLPAQHTLVLDTKSQGQAIPTTMWGLFFEDINLAADGGIYAELVKNRSFEFATPLMGWKEWKANGAEGQLLVHNRGTASSNNPRYLRITNAGKGAYGISNEGFRGMGIQKDLPYHFSCQGMALSGDATLHLELRDPDGKSLGGTILNFGTAWKKYNITFTATGTHPKAQLVLWTEKAGAIQVDFVSLFPSNTWKNRPGGLRTDLVQLLADMQPGFLRFPGGCIVEGRTLETRYQWKKTIGIPEERTVLINRWNDEFKHRPTPDYFQSFGLGFYEYFLLAEDIGAAPLPILNCGMACQFNSSEVVALEDLDPFIQDALDLIEFANGPADSRWGKLRADMGHPAPFHLKHLGVGNEQWGPQYMERYLPFVKVLKEKHPEIQIVGSVGPFSDGPEFDYLNTSMRANTADLLDEHYYKEPAWFLNNATRYDGYDRKGPKIFAGEYAAQSIWVVSPENKNTWKCALSEAAFMTGLERNADVVHMASYAPLFAHVDGWQWTPNLIWFDNLRSVGTVNYQVQKLFSTHRGTHTAALHSNGKPVTGAQGIYASAVRDEAKKLWIVKLVNSNTTPVTIRLENTAQQKWPGTIHTLTLQHMDLEAENTLDNPAQLVPMPGNIMSNEKWISIKMEAQSIQVLKLPMSR